MSYGKGLLRRALRGQVLQGLDPEELAITLKVLGQIIERIDEMR